MDSLLTIHELSQALKLPLSTLYSYTRQRGTNTIPLFRCGRHIRFRLAEVIAWFESRQGNALSISTKELEEE